MKNVMIGATAALVAGMGSAVAQQTISPAADRPSTIGSPDHFTAQVIVEPYFDANELRNVSAAKVTFSAGARTAWHTHPTGQTLVVLSGTGWIQIDGGHRQTIAAGDVVWFPPDVRHWHGATDANAMSHIAVTGVHAESGAVDWLEHVTDEQYRGD